MGVRPREPSTLTRTPLAALSWLGRQGTRAVAALVVVGIALPSVGTVLKPHVTEAVVVLLTLAFLRLDMAAARTELRRPTLLIAATLWTSVAVPVMVGLAGRALGVDRTAPDLYLALMLQAVASPMMATPAIVAIMGLDATLVLVTLVASTALVPFTAPALAHAFVGPGLALSPLVLAARLFAVLAGAAVVGLGLRRALGGASIERHRHAIDGLNILVLAVFVAAVMESLGARGRAAPAKTSWIAALAVAVFTALLATTFLLFLKAGRERALALGVMAAQRNLGLMLAGSGGALPDMAWLYFALSQFPIYLAPLVLQPVVRRFVRRDAATGAGLD